MNTTVDDVVVDDRSIHDRTPPLYQPPHFYPPTCAHSPERAKDIGKLIGAYFEVPADDLLHEGFDAQLAVVDTVLLCVPDECLRKVMQCGQCR
jgi:hypothetical protein